MELFNLNFYQLSNDIKLAVQMMPVRMGLFSSLWWTFRSMMDCQMNRVNP